MKEPYPVKIKPKSITKDMFISNILIVEAIIKNEMLRNNMSYKKVTSNIYLDILPATYHKELMAKVIFSILLFNFFLMITLKSLSVEKAFDIAKIKLDPSRPVHFRKFY